MSKQQRLVLIITILASLVAFLDGSVVNVALPAITRDMGGGLVVQQWVVDSYMITLGALILLAGSLSDLLGRWRVLKVGLIGFGLASLLCAIAPNSQVLIAARGLQGVAGALLVPSSLALIIATFTGAAQGKAIGAWTAWTGMAFLFGPLLGGFFVDAASWRLVFAINVLPISLTLWLITKVSQADRPKEHVPIDVVGALLCVIGLFGLVYGLIEQSHLGWSSGVIQLSFGGGILLLGLFVAYEKWWARYPMLPLELFTVRNFSVGNIATMSIYAGLSIAAFLLAVFVQQVGHYSALQAGLALMPVTVIMFFLSSRFGNLAGKYGPRWFMTVGPIIAAIGFLMMLVVDARVLYVSQLLPGILLYGLGLSITVSPLTSAVLSSIESRQAGIASAVNNMVARIAGLIGVALIGAVVGTKLDITGFRHMIILTAALMLVGGVVSAIGIQNKVAKDLVKTGV